MGAGRNQPPQRIKQHAPSKLPQENSSLPPFRGEARWGVGDRERPRRSCAPRSPTQPPYKRATPTPLLVSPLKGGRDEFSRGQTLVGARPPPPPVIPAYAGMTEWAQAGTPLPNAPTNTHQANSPKKIHPSPLLGGRLGGGWNAASEAPSPASTTALQPLSPRLLSLVIPAQAGTADWGPDRRHDRWWTIGASHPPPNLPPKRGEGLNWGRGEGDVVRVGFWPRRFLPAPE